MKATTLLLLLATCLLTASCGLVTPECTAKDHTWTRWSQPSIRGRALTNVWGETILRRHCTTCGWMDSRKTNPCDL